MESIIDQGISVLFVTETWLTSMKNDVTATIKSYGYNLIYYFRTDSAKCRGGGVGIIYKPSNLNLTPVFVKCGDTFEAVLGKLRDSSGDTVLCACVYRPGSLTDAFFDDLDEFIGNIFLKYKKFLICGDLNIHLDDQKSGNTTKLTDLLASYGLHQYVRDATHNKGHILDVVISSHQIVNPNSVTVDSHASEMFPNCDHYPVTFSLTKTVANNLNQKKVITFRNVKEIDQKSFADDLAEELVAAMAAMEKMKHDDHYQTNNSYDQFYLV